MLVTDRTVLSSAHALAPSMLITEVYSTLIIPSREECRSTTNSELIWNWWIWSQIITCLYFVCLCIYYIICWYFFVLNAQRCHGWAYNIRDPVTHTCVGGLGHWSSKLVNNLSNHRGLVTCIYISNLGQHWYGQWLAVCSAPSHIPTNADLLSIVEP